MNRFILFVFMVLFFGISVKAEGVLTMHKVTNTIVGNLYATMGNKTVTVPKVKIIHCSNPGKCTGARYRKRENTIELEAQLYSVCRSFGRDSLSALAFILGHELGHFYSEYTPEESLGLNAQYNNTNHRTDREHKADVHGIFNAYLAGYDTRKIIPRLLEAIYNQYKLKGKPLYGYPSLQERKYTPQEVLTKVDELIHTFDLANYLSAIGAYEEAAAAYEHILQYYKGKEIFNNLGVCYTLNAINFTKIDYDVYVFPLELDLDTRLKKDKSDTGVDAIGREDIRKRNMLLNKAMQQFRHISKMDRSYLLDDLNIISVYILKQEYQQALQYFQASALEKKAFYQNSPSLEKSKIQLVKALALTHVLNRQQEAITIWQKLTKDYNAGIAFQASYNLAVMTGNNAPKCETSYECYEPVNTNITVDYFKMKRQSVSSIPLGINSNYQFNFQHKANSIIYALTKPNGQQLVIQRIIKGTFKNRQRIRVPDLRFNSVNTVLANGNYFTVCEKKQTAFLGTKDNRLQEWIKYEWF